MPVNNEFIDRFLDGDASDDEAADVVQWLEVPANLERFALRAELHADLRSSLRRRCIQVAALESCNENEIAPALMSSDRHDSSGWRRSRMTIGFGSIALLAAACLLIAFVIPHEERGPDSSQPHFAAIVSEIGAVLTSGESSWDETGLSAGEYQLRRGLLHLRFDAGVMVFVEAPARFSAESGKRLVLYSGRLSANVPPKGIGFTVETPEAEVVDFGTEFSVDVEVGKSEVHVFDGLVRVQPRSGSGSDNTAAVNLRASQAVRIDDSSPKPVEITLAIDRFIRNFAEPKRKYARSVKQLLPAAYYRMPIRDRGLVSEPPQYSGEVLTGDGIRPPHSQGVFAGGSLRVKADSTGRGGRVDTPPPLVTGSFTLSVFVYLETRALDATVVTNIRANEGNFGLALDEKGLLRAKVRSSDGELQSVTATTLLPLKTWRHLVMVVDGEYLRIYEDAQLVASAQCSLIANAESETVWFGTRADGLGLWDGRIDELALFDKALSEKDVADLYQAALEELARSE